MNTRHLLMGVLLLNGLWLSIYGDRTPTAPVVEAVTRPNADAAQRAVNPPPARVTRAQSDEPQILRIRARSELIASATSPIEALFGTHTWTPPPPPPPPAPKVVALPPPKPTAPPLPFTYIGKKLENGRWEAYLARGAETYIVRDRTLIDDAYRAESIAPPNLTITYLPLKQVQTLQIGDAE